MTTYVFSGHREVYHPGIEVRLDTELENLLQADNAFLFLTGGMGQFDSISANAVRAAKHRHPKKHITLALVLPYMSNRLNKQKEYYQFYYDQIIIPEELNTAYCKAAIQLRNRWMVNRSDTVIAYVCRDFGGALATITYAQKQGKSIINLAEEQ